MSTQCQLPLFPFFEETDPITQFNYFITMVINILMKPAGTGGRAGFPK